MDHKNDGLAIFAIIISIIGCICAMFPLLNIVSIVVIFIGFVISVVVLANGKSRALSIIAMLVSIFTVIIAINIDIKVVGNFNKNNSSYRISNINNNDNVVKNFIKSVDKSSDEILKDIDVLIDIMDYDTNSSGMKKIKLSVKVTNKSDTRKSYIINIAAIGKGNYKIVEDSIYVLNLDPGEVKTYEAFKFDEISDEEFNMIKDAKFKVINAKEYLNDGIINKEDLKDNNLVK